MRGTSLLILRGFKPHPFCPQLILFKNPKFSHLFSTIWVVFVRFPRRIFSWIPLPWYQVFQFQFSLLYIQNFVHHPLIKLGIVHLVYIHSQRGFFHPWRRRRPQQRRFLTSSHRQWSSFKVFSNATNLSLQVCTVTFRYISQKYIKQ